MKRTGRLFLSAVALMAAFGTATLSAETKITASKDGKGTPKYVFVFIY